MKNQIMKISMLLLAASIHSGLAQPPCSALGMSLAEVTHKGWYRRAPQSADFTIWQDSNGVSQSFSSPARIWPISEGNVYVIDSGNLLNLKITKSGTGSTLTGALTKTGNAVAMADDGKRTFVLTSAGIRVMPKNESYPLPAAYAGTNPVDIIFDGTFLWFSSNSNAYLGRAVYTPSTSTTPSSMTFTVQNVAAPLTRLAFDGRYIWGAAANGSVYKFDGFTQAAQYTPGYAGAPKSLTFDGYSLWVTTGTSANIYRVRISDGSQLSSVSVAGSPRGLAFDGSHILSVDSTSGLLRSYRACDATAMPDVQIPTRSENVIFDGVNYWVSSPASKMVSVR